MATKKVDVVRPQVGLRQVTVDVPDSLVGLFAGNGTGKQVATRSAEVARNLAERGTEAVARSRQTAGPVLASAAATTTVTAGKLATKGAKLAVNAREVSSTAADKARAEWIPAARERIEEGAPAVGAAVQTGATKLGVAATAARVAAGTGLRSAAQTSGQAARTAAGATASGLQQLFSTMFWLGVVIWLLIRIFRPEPEQREALYGRVRRMAGM